MPPYLQRLEDGPAVGGQLGVGGLAEELGEGGDGVQLVGRDLETTESTVEVTKGGIGGRGGGSLQVLLSTHLGELAVSEPLQPPHAVAGLPLAGGSPGDHDAGPPGESLDLPPDQLADAKAFVVLQQEGGRTGRNFISGLSVKVPPPAFSHEQEGDAVVKPPGCNSENTLVPNWELQQFAKKRIVNKRHTHTLKKWSKMYKSN